MNAFDALRALCHHRWNIPVLAHVAHHGGARVVVLERSLGVARAPLKAALDHLLDLGLIMRNPGYGHPLRPEYILVPERAGIAAPCVALAEEIETRQLAVPMYRKWSLPLLCAINAGDSRFNDLRRSLQATPRALTQSLTQLEDVELIERRLIDARPPHNAWFETEVGIQIALPADQLASHLAA